MKSEAGCHYTLVTLTGPDSPGITSEVMEILGKHKLKVMDLGQAVIQGLLSLSVLFEVSKDQDENVMKDLLFAAKQINMNLDYKRLEKPELPESSAPKKASRFVLTVIGSELLADALAKVTKCFSEYSLNIDTIQKVSEGELQILEMHLSSPKVMTGNSLKKDLIQVALHESLDLALQKDTPFRRARRLVAFDMDSTLIQNEVIVEFARELGKEEEVHRITEEAMNGNLDFAESLKQRCALLKGMDLSCIDKVYERIELTQGAEELIRTLKKLGYKVALISGGFTLIADRLKERLNIDYVFANKLEVRGTKLTGNLMGTIVDASKKAEFLEVITQQEGISLEQVIAIGDGANDLEMLERAGLGIAFNAKPIVRARADSSLRHKSLQPVFHILGLHKEDLQELGVGSKNRS